MNSPQEIASNYIQIGINKTQTPAFRTFLLAIMAGIFIALGGSGATAASATITNASAAKLISGCIFPAGLVMVLLAGSELFTGNCLICISVFSKKVPVLDMVKNLVIVFAGNLVGGILIDLLLVQGHTMSLFGNGFAETAISIASAKVSLSFTECLIRGIMCNIFVCLAVWVATAAKDVAGKILALYLPILIFVVLGFEHCVANMYYIPVAIFTAQAYGLDPQGVTWAGFAGNMIPVTIGNIIGGVFIGFMYWMIYLKDQKTK